MSEHVLNWLAPYYDQELSGEQAAVVEAHLAGCQGCRVELEALRNLSSLLKTVPPLSAAAVEHSPALIRQRITHVEPKPLAWQRALQLGWAAAPWIIVTAWSFLQAVLLISGGLISAQTAGLDLSWSMLTSGEATGTSLWSFLPAQLPGLDLGLPVLTAMAFNLVLTALFAVLLWSWLAGWWVYRRHLVLVSPEQQPVSRPA